MIIREFATSRCLVDRVLPEDRETIVAMFLDPVVRLYLGGPASPKSARQAARAAASDTGRRDVRAVRLADEGDLAGLLCLGPHHDGADVEVSYLLAPTYWGRGIASEVVGGLLERVVEDSAVSRVIAETQRDNRASRRVLDKVGMRPIRELVRFGAPQIIYAIETRGGYNSSLRPNSCSR